jgi:uncharacterized membrane protein YfcA
MIWRGVIDSRIWLIVAVAFPFSVLGTQTGIFVFRRLNDRQFQRLLIWLILASGLVLLGRELIANMPSALGCYWHFLFFVTGMIMPQI